MTTPSFARRSPRRLTTVLSVGVVACALQLFGLTSSVRAQAPDRRDGNRPAPAKEQAVQILRQLHASLERHDYEEAIQLLQLPPPMDADRVKRSLMEFLQNKEISRAGIDILAAKGKWGPLAEVLGTERAALLAKRARVAAEACYAFALDDAEAVFYWDGKRFLILRCNNVGQLSGVPDKSDQRTTRPAMERGQDVRRVVYANPIAGFQIEIPEDWEMATGAAGNTEMAIDASTGARLWGQPALWFFYAPQPPERQAPALAEALRLLGGRDVTAQQNANGEWEVRAAFKVPVLGELVGRWRCRRERGMNYVIGAGVRSDLMASFREDIEKALATCRLMDHPIMACFHEPTERAYRILLPEGWRWEGAIIRTREVPGFFTWKASSADGTVACLTGPPAAFNMFQDYTSADQAARGVVLEGLRKQVPDAQLEDVTTLARASAHYREGMRLLGLNSKFDKVRADYLGTVRGVRVRARLEIASWMPMASTFPDPRLHGRGNWYVVASGAWAPVNRFDELYPLARGVHASLRTSPEWIKKQRETVGKVLADRTSAMDEAYKGWDAYIRDMERIPDPDGGPPQEVPNRDGGVWKDPSGRMHRVSRNPNIENALRNRGWKQIQ